jgi:hypothetical protein
MCPGVVWCSHVWAAFQGFVLACLRQGLSCRSECSSAEGAGSVKGGPSGPAEGGPGGAPLTGSDPGATRWALCAACSMPAATAGIECLLTWAALGAVWAADVWFWARIIGLCGAVAACCAFRPRPVLGPVRVVVCGCRCGAGRSVAQLVGGCVR